MAEETLSLAQRLIQAVGRVNRINQKQNVELICNNASDLLAVRDELRLRQRG